MAKKYVKDYRLTDSVNTRGKLHTECEYIGGYFFFSADAEGVRRKARLLGVFCAAGWACWLAPLFCNNGAMHIPFISFPYLFAALSLWLMSTAAYTALTAKEPMKRRQADRLRTWIPGTSLATAILSGIALLGIAISLIFQIGSLNSFDWLFGSCAALLFTISVAVFSIRKAFRMEER